MSAPEKPLHFLRAAHENEQILTSLLEWMDGQRQKKIDALIGAHEHDTIMRLQGEIVGIGALVKLLSDMTRPK